jgi:hypothetical protein
VGITQQCKRGTGIFFVHMGRCPSIPISDNCTEDDVCYDHDCNGCDECVIIIPNDDTNWCFSCEYDVLLREANSIEMADYSRIKYKDEIDVMRSNFNNLLVLIGWDFKFSVCSKYCLSKLIGDDSPETSIIRNIYSRQNYPLLNVKDNFKDDLEELQWKVTVSGHSSVSLSQLIAFIEVCVLPVEIIYLIFNCMGKSNGFISRFFIYVAELINYCDNDCCAEVLVNGKCIVHN